MATEIASIVGYVLFVLSELLPFVSIEGNGFLETVILSFKNGFRKREIDVEIAGKNVKDKSLARMTNAISTNPQLKRIVEACLDQEGVINSVYDTLVHFQIQEPVPAKVKEIIDALKEKPEMIGNIRELVALGASEPRV